MQGGNWVLLANDNSVANAYDLRDLSSEIVLSGLSISTAGSGGDEYFEFTTLSSGVPGQYIELDTNSNAGGLLMSIVNASGVVVQAGGAALETTKALDSEQLSLDGLAAGTYYLVISGATSSVTNPSYTLTFLPPQTPEPDYAEPNNTPGMAYNVGNAAGAATTRGQLNGALRHSPRRLTRSARSSTTSVTFFRANQALIPPKQEMAVAFSVSGRH